MAKRAAMGHGRIAVVEAMRGIAAISVALFHFSVQLEGPARDIFAYGWIGVDVFFVISGFVIPLSLFGRGYSLRNFPQFLLRRMVRLEPPYLASVALVLTVWYLAAVTPGGDDRPDYSWLQLASHLLYAIPLTHYAWISAAYWSLAYEFVFYVVAGLTFASLIERPIEWTVLLAALITAALYPVEGAFDVCIAEFLAGIIVMRIVTGQGEQKRLWFWLAASIAVSCFIAGPWVGAAIAVAAAAILLLRQHQFGRCALAIGSMSYSLYLTHTSIGIRVMQFGKDLATGLPTQIALMMAALAITIAFAFVFARLIERPSIQASRQIAA
jgi:peptidoglycan/LPS O-acetylase OafA/YrhL